jgi:hypothetical protein
MELVERGLRLSPIGWPCIMAEAQDAGGKRGFSSRGSRRDPPGAADIRRCQKPAPVPSTTWRMPSDRHVVLLDVLDNGQTLKVARLDDIWGSEAPEFRRVFLA